MRTFSPSSKPPQTINRTIVELKSDWAAAGLSHEHTIVELKWICMRPFPPGVRLLLYVKRFYYSEICGKVSQKSAHYCILGQKNDKNSRFQPDKFVFPQKMLIFAANFSANHNKDYSVVFTCKWPCLPPVMWSLFWKAATDSVITSQRNNVTTK